MIRAKHQYASPCKARGVLATFHTNSCARRPLALHTCIQLTISRQPRVTADGLLAMLRAVPSLAVVVAVRCHRLHRAALRGISRCLAAGDGAARGVRLLTDREDCDDNAPFAWAGVVL